MVFWVYEILIFVAVIISFSAKEFAWAEFAEKRTKAGACVFQALVSRDQAILGQLYDLLTTMVVLTASSVC